MNTLYVARTGNNQGLICDEATGANVAVTYKAEDAPYIANACNTHERLVQTLESLLRELKELDECSIKAPSGNYTEVDCNFNAVQRLIDEAKG